MNSSQIQWNRSILLPQNNKYSSIVFKNIFYNDFNELFNFILHLSIRVLFLSLHYFCDIIYDRYMTVCMWIVRDKIYELDFYIVLNISIHQTIQFKWERINCIILAFFIRMINKSNWFQLLSSLKIIHWDFNEVILTDSYIFITNINLQSNMIIWDLVKTTLKFTLSI
jgi:hypothetical protein